MMAALDAYRLPEGNVQIAFSGGRTSAYMLHHILEANGGLPDRAEVTFQNTGREMPETLDFVAEVGRRMQIMITWLEYRSTKPLFEVVGYQGASRNGEPFEALIRRKQALPNQFQKFCSAELKTLTARRYMRSKGWTRWVSAVGFRADEMHRTAYPDKRILGWLPLRVAGVTKRDVAAFWAGQSYDLRLPCIGGKTIGGNCDGCFLKSERFLSGLSLYHPDRAKWWELLETQTGRKFSKRYTRAELRAFLEKQGDWILDSEDVLCQANGGECAA